MLAASGVTVRAEIARVNYTRIVQRWNSWSLIGWDESGSSFGSRPTAVGARAARFERRAGNCARCCCARRTEFAQGAHRFCLTGFKVSRFQGFKVSRTRCGSVFPSFRRFLETLQLCNSETSFVSVAALAVGDAGQHSGVGGDGPAVTVSGGVGGKIILRAGLVLVAGDVEAGVEVEGIGWRHAVLNQAEGRGLSVVARLLVSFVVLVDGGGLGSGAVGVKKQGDVQLQRPALVDGVDEIAAGVVDSDGRLDSGGLVNILRVDRGEDFEVLQVGEVDILGDGGGDGAERGVDVSGDLEVVAGLRGDGALDVPVLRGIDIFRDVGYGHGERVLGERAGDLSGTRIEIEQERGSGGEVAVGIEHAEGNGVGLTVVKQGGERRQVDTVGQEVHGLNAGDGTPQIRIDASGVDPGIDGRYSGGSAVDGDFGFAEGGAGAALEFSGHVVGDAAVPEFVAGLALGKDVEIDVRNVGRKRQSLFEQVGRGVEGDGSAGGAGREGDDLIGGTRRHLIRFQRVEEDVGIAMENAGIGLVDQVAKIDGAGLRDGED